MFATLMRPGALLLAAGWVLAGCAGPLEPGPSFETQPSANIAADRGDDALAAHPKHAGPLFYPLDLGNHWEYALTFEFRTGPPGGQLSDPEVIASTLDVDLVGTEQRFGREYIVQRERVHDGGSDFANDFLYRQDRGGLYNADPEPTAAGTWVHRARAVERRVAAAFAKRFSPATTEGRAYQKTLLGLLAKSEMLRHLASSRGVARLEAPRPGPLEGEIALLRYPLHARKSWQVREDPLVVYTVEREAALDLPAGRFRGWRIRIDWPDLFGPTDRAHVWYGRDGLLRLTAHLTGDVTDEDGNVVGTIVSDQDQVLTDRTLVRALAKRRP